MVSRIVILFAFIPALLWAQPGGNTTYNYLNLEYSARAAGLGGDHILGRGDDLNMGVLNPANLNSEMAKSIIFNQSILPAGITHSLVGYAHEFDKVGIFSGHLRYVSYGKFDRTDPNGVSSGTFSAGDFALGIGYSRALNKRFTVGANLNMYSSFYAGYNSFGMGLDLGVTYYHEEANLIASLLIKNAGIQFSAFNKGNREPLPIEAQIGVSYKFHKAPFRLGVIYRNIEKWDLTYVTDADREISVDQLTGDTIQPNVPGFGEKLLRHFLFFTEINITDYIHIRAGFDYQRRQTLKIDERPGVAGFSFGAGFNIKHLIFDYGISFYSVAAMQHHIGIRTNISAWKKKAPPPEEDEITPIERPE